MRNIYDKVVIFRKPNGEIIKLNIFVPETMNESAKNQFMMKQIDIFKNDIPEVASYPMFIKDVLELKLALKDTDRNKRAVKCDAAGNLYYDSEYKSQADIHAEKKTALMNKLKVQFNLTNEEVNILVR